jgi:uncharacterized protein (TIGR03435 family)
MKASVITLVLMLPAVYGQPVAPAVFEVASIRLHDGPLSRIGDYSASGPRLTLGAYNVALLIMEAYDLKNYQLSFPSKGPGLDDYYDITAIAPGNTIRSRD